MKSFKILGLLLTYPEGSLYQAEDELLAILRRESVLPSRFIVSIGQFLQAQKCRELLQVQEEYVDTFDSGRAHCLHLFEHIHGESRDRGLAMVNLMEAYASKGLYIESGELPDYLPLFMEYLSCCPFKEACELLGEAIDVIAMIGAKLQRRQSPYAVIFASLEALSAVSVDKTRVAQALESAPKDPETLEELDEEWREAEAFSGDPRADCHSCNSFAHTTQTLEKMLRGT